MDFVVPDRNKIGGSLLKLNYENCQAQNKKSILTNALLMGLIMLGDGATVAKMPLINVLILCAALSPVTLCINDCTEHMQSGGKKDASYIATLFEIYAQEYDKLKQLIDLFYFDGAGNVQKAGRILIAKYPRAYCLHGGEHVVSLFFDDIAKLKAIKVRC